MWLPGVDQGGWKDSRKVPHAALMRDGSVGRSRGKDQPGKGSQSQGPGSDGQSTGQWRPVPLGCQLIESCRKRWQAVDDGLAWVGASEAVQGSRWQTKESAVDASRKRSA